MEMQKKYRASFLTLGCRVSQYETEAIRESLLARGFIDTPKGEVADCVVINTCTVTEESDRKSAKAVRRAIRENPGAVVLVIGCSSEAASELYEKIPGVAYIGGTDDQTKAVDAACRLLSLREEGKLPPLPLVSLPPLTGAAYEPMQLNNPPHPRTRAYVKIADGCDWQCTYCAIHSARGPARSRPSKEILCEVERLCRSGVREVVLTGIETASYGRDLENYRLIDLLEEVAKLPVARIRLGSLTPEVFTEEFIKRASAIESLMPHFHISLQSGSSEVLRRMKRRYTAEAASAAIARLRAAFPDLQLSCDIIVGFPGESEESFGETLRFVREAEFLHMHVFPYSKRAGTPAAAYEGQLPAPEKKRRSRELSALGEELRQAILTRILRAGKPLSVLFESSENGVFTGHSDSFIPVLCEGEGLSGRICSVIPTHIENGCIIGKIKKDI